MYVKEPIKKKHSCGSILGLFILALIIIGTIVGLVIKGIIGDGNLSAAKELSYLDPTNDYVIDESGSFTIPKYVHTFMLLGSDFRPESGFRTDVIVLVAVNLRESKINMLSFPRDLWVTIPGWEENRINVAFPVGGFERLADTMVVNFGFRPDHYVLVDFNGFKKFVNKLGGIDVNVTDYMEDHCEFNLERWCKVEPGVVHMDGDYALWYVRARYNSSDFDRTRRTQEVVQAIARKSLSFSGMMRASSLIKVARNSFETDLRVKDLWALIRRSGKLLKDDAFTSYMIGPEMAADWWTASGANVLLPDIPAIQQVIAEVLWINPK